MYFSTALSVQQKSTGFERTLVEHYKVKFRKLSQAEIERYVEIEQPLHCAGSFKCESLGISLFETMIGQGSNYPDGYADDSAMQYSA